MEKVLYHFIPVFNLISLLEEYKSLSKIFLKSNSEHISLTRNPSLTSVDLSFDKHMCRITLDTKKIYDRYKIKPYADSTYTQGSDEEQEERVYVKKRSNWQRNYDKALQIPTGAYKIDISDCILRIDILTMVHNKVKDRQAGYNSWMFSYDQFNPKYLDPKNKKNLPTIQKDHEGLVHGLFNILKQVDLPFKVKLVTKFVGYKYQDKYIDKWNRRSFSFNSFGS